MKQNQKLIKACFERDGYACQRCDKVFTSRAMMLIIHRVMRPGSDNESEEPANFITLCRECNAYVEANGLLTRLSMRKSLPDYDPYFAQIDSGPKAWHAWVYGGDSPPPQRKGPPIDVIGDALARVAADALAEVRRKRGEMHG